MRGKQNKHSSSSNRVIKVVSKSNVLVKIIITKVNDDSHVIKYGRLFPEISFPMICPPPPKKYTEEWRTAQLLLLPLIVSFNGNVQGLSRKIPSVDQIRLFI